MGSARSTETTGRLWVEEGDAQSGLMAEVALATHASRAYTFFVPSALAAQLELGHRVEVPLGKKGRMVQGFVVRISEGQWEGTLRPIESLVDDESFLTQELIDLGREIAAHYACPLGVALKAITPEAVRRGRGMKTVRYVRLARGVDEIRADGGRISPQRLTLLEALDRLNQMDGDAAYLSVDKLLEETGVSAAVLNGMANKDWITIESRREAKDDDTPTAVLDEPTFELTDEQSEALEQINERIRTGKFGVTLLYGVSGSGKTEVYVRAIRQVVAEGKQAILLVPEIVLTTQIVRRLAARFESVAVIHSGLTGVQRSLIWRRIASGERSVVIGTRSAVFAPCPNLGLICVDEEQETSYKNLQAPRFHVRDVAIMRSNRLGIPVLLGSATPAVETWYNSEHRSTYHKVSLSKRVNDQAMPKVHVIDMRDEFTELRRVVVLSRSMERLLGETLDRGEQAMLLVNRRGFSHRVFCPACKSGLTCPHCNVSLVAHSTTGHSICHYCRTRVATPTHCQNIGCGEKLIHMGLGTQRVEETLAQRFPNAKIARVDSDTMKHRDEYQRIVDDFEQRRVDVLVGTQMIAKGLDFPFVSFVGVVHADTNALAADFRAQERLFQLITQVAGRAGRAETSGRVVVQTSMPELPGLKFALTHDYLGFAEAELASRKRAAMPPFRRVTRIVLAHSRNEVAEKEAGAMAERIREAIKDGGFDYADVLGPSPCVLSRLRGRYRHDMLVRTADASSMRKLLRELNQRHALRSRAESTVVDVDPVSLS